METLKRLTTDERRDIALVPSSRPEIERGSMLMGVASRANRFLNVSNIDFPPERELATEFPHF
jgi:hypothetical protein